MRPDIHCFRWNKSSRFLNPSRGRECKVITTLKESEGFTFQPASDISACEQHKNWRNHSIMSLCVTSLPEKLDFSSIMRSPEAGFI